MPRAHSRTPHGVRGLKSEGIARDAKTGESHPSRGAWIEILKNARKHHVCYSRTPHGVRGLKLRDEQTRSIPDLSHPSRGAWIEISWTRPKCRIVSSHPSRGAWIEIKV